MQARVSKLIREKPHFAKAVGGLHLGTWNPLSTERPEYHENEGTREDKESVDWRLLLAFVEKSGFAVGQIRCPGHAKYF